MFVAALFTIASTQKQQRSTFDLWQGVKFLWPEKNFSDHTPRTRAEWSKGCCFSPLARSGNCHVFLRSQGDDDREDVVWMMWCGTSPQPQRFSPSHKGTWNSPFPTWRSPLWPGVSLPWDDLGNVMSKRPILPVLKIGLALSVTPFLMGGAPILTQCHSH